MDWSLIMLRYAGRIGNAMTNSFSDFRTALPRLVAVPGSPGSGCRRNCFDMVRILLLRGLMADRAREAVGVGLARLSEGAGCDLFARPAACRVNVRRANKVSYSSYFAGQLETLGVSGY
jgi:hypothetical protein